MPLFCTSLTVVIILDYLHFHRDLVCGARIRIRKKMVIATFLACHKQHFALQNCEKV